MLDIRIGDLHVDKAALSKALELVDLSQAQCPSCEYYFELFGKKAESEETAREALQFLCILCSWRLRADDPNQPYEAWWDDATTAELTAEQCESLSELADAIVDSDIKARVTDILWLLTRDHTRARQAVTSLFDVVEALLNSGGEIHVRERLRRAMHVAAQLGKKNDCFVEAQRRLIELARREDIENVTVAEALEILAASGRADAGVGLQISDDRLRRVREGVKSPIWERRFLELKAVFAVTDGDKVVERDALIEVAKTFEEEALKATVSSVAYCHWERALLSYRRIARTEADRDRVHKELLKAQEEMVSEMHTISTGTIDVSRLIDDAEERVRGVSLPRALAELACVTTWREKAEVRRQAEKNIAAHPLQHLFTQTQLGGSGKVAAIASGVTPQEQQMESDRLRAAMCRWYMSYIGVVANGRIDPMRQSIVASHLVGIPDVYQLLRYSPVIPHGRLWFWQIGIHAGLHGRYLEALHVLVPQLEHLVRAEFNRSGRITSTFDKDGVQEEYHLNRLLGLDVADEILSADLCYVLRVVFTDRHGYNLRNELAHGMLSADACYSAGAVFAWWLLYRIVVGPVAKLILDEDLGRAPDADIR